MRTRNPIRTFLHFAPRILACRITGHQWVDHASPSVTIRICSRCAESRWTT